MTFHDSHNCGSMLQAYALQHYIIESLGISNEIIDYSNICQRRMYAVLFKPSNIKELMRNILNILYLGKLIKHKNDYVKFSNKYLIKSNKKYSSREELMREKFDYTHLLAGSDQVWNVHAKDYDDSYMLAFASDVRKIAYAVSLGGTNFSQESMVNEYTRLINDFSDISVREKNAQLWIQPLYKNGTVEICVDPTLLLAKEDWLPLANKREVNQKYIFWYAMTYKKDVLQVVKAISKKTNLPVYIIDAKEWSRRGLFLHGIKLAKDGGPSSFLSLVKNAELVLTSSFHGTIFSYIFEKKFWYIRLNDKPTQDDRASFLLSQLGLSDRYVTKKQILEVEIMKDPVCDATSTISKDIDLSKDFLRNALFS